MANTEEMPNAREASYDDKSEAVITTAPSVPPTVDGGRAETPTLEEVPVVEDAKMPDANSKQLDEIKALTMHSMVDMDPSGRKRLIFVTNHQAKLFNSSNISSFLQSLEYPTSKLVIWFMPCCGGSATITNGMITQFKQLKASDPDYEQKWKKLLKVQAVNSPDPGYVQDVLPIPPFIDDEDMFKAEWKMECFMRDVLVPLAAETSALIIGSAFKDASLMMMFARVARSLASKYGGMGGSPWTMLGFAGAPKLLKMINNPTSEASAWMKFSPRWQERRGLIATAKRNSNKGETPGSVEDFDIPYDVNPDLGNMVVIDCVNADGLPKIDMSGKNHIEAVIMDYLVNSLPVIGVGTMHAVGGYAGLSKAVTYLNMKVPLLLLDLRDRPVSESEEVEQTMSEQDRKEALEHHERERLAEAIRLDNELSIDLNRAGKADIYESCRVAYFHSRFLKSTSSGSEAEAKRSRPKTIWQAIDVTRKQMQNAGSGEDALKKQRLLETVMEHCVQKEFENYWNLLSEEEKESFREVQGYETYKQRFAMQMVDARAAYNGLLSNELLYTAHASELTELDFLVNRVLMTKEHLPDKNSLDGLLMLRGAWDLVDIAQHQLKFFKRLAKFLFALLLILGIAIVAVTVQTADLDKALTVNIGARRQEFDNTTSTTNTSPPEGGTALPGAQFITFALSLVSSFVAAVQAFYNPVRRWHQVRDASESMLSAIWQYRTRTAQYKQDATGPGPSTLALSEAVMKCKEAIMTSADVQETSFHKFYPISIFTHGQRPNPKGKNKVVPQDIGDGPEDEEIVYDSMDPEAPKVQEIDSFDDHYSPTKPDEYIRLRMLKALRFYRERLPSYAAKKDVSQWTIMVGTATGALIAFIGFAPQVAIISSVTAAIASWMEFTTTATKVARYNAIIVALTNLLLWWDSLSLVDKASPLNVDLLVMKAEETLSAERAAWVGGSGSEDSKKKGDGDEEEEGDDAKKKS